MLSYKTPAVYIEELPTTGPIEGVGTSTAAFIGAALKGPIVVPTKITNWTQFKDTFGSYILAPRLMHFMAYAVRGFFDNGGTVAYIVRASTAAQAFADLPDRAQANPLTAVRIQAKDAGTAGNGIKVTVQDANIVPQAQNAQVLRAAATISGSAANVVTLANAADAALFAVGDLVTIDGTAEVPNPIQGIMGAQLRLANAFSTNYGGNKTVRIADLTAGQATFRVQTGDGIEPGSSLTLSGGAKSENVVVGGVSGQFITLDAGLANGYSLAAANAGLVAIVSNEFTLVVALGAQQEIWPNLAMDPRHSRYFAHTVASAWVDAIEPPSPTVQLPPNNRPLAGQKQLAGGADDSLNGLLPLVNYTDALDTLEKVDDVNIVCMPGLTSNAVQSALVTHCEKMSDRFAILDSQPGTPPFGQGSVLSQEATVASVRGYAALYYPWIKIVDPSSATGDVNILVPPSGHVAGVFARSDTERGVHKAPANEPVRTAFGLARTVDAIEQGELNIGGVDVLRIFSGQALPLVWGARTTAAKESDWRYVNVRRLLLFIEQSIKVGLRWAVFEPNDLGLWKRLTRTLTEFLTRVWRSGALFGATADQAFYVKIDEENNPPSVRDLGQVIIEIGVAPVRPAEFVVVRIGIWDGGSQVTES